MLNLKKTLTHSATNISKFLEIYDGNKVLRDKALNREFGKHAKLVNCINDVLLAASWAVAYDDYTKKRGFKQATLNQVIIIGGMAGVATVFNVKLHNSVKSI